MWQGDLNKQPVYLKCSARVRLLETQSDVQTYELNTFLVQSLAKGKKKSFWFLPELI